MRSSSAGELCELLLHTVTCLASLYVGRGSEWGGGGGGGVQMSVVGKSWLMIKKQVNHEYSLFNSRCLNSMQG